MVRKLGVIGAGSIGNHLSYSFGKLDWKICVLDIDTEALKRFQEEIFPKRYGFAPDHIDFYNNYDDFFKEKFDLVIIGTPPDTHTTILSDISSVYRGDLLVEKPICTPTHQDISAISEFIDKHPGNVFVGYNHRVARVTKLAINCLSELSLGNLESINVSWKESWQGILNAHPWLDSPSDSYLGFTERGGGSLFEHSHGIDIAVYFSSLFDGSRLTLDSASASYITSVDLDYDESVTIEIRTEKGARIRVARDVLTFPAEKSIELNFESGNCVINFGVEGNIDKLFISSGEIVYSCVISKTRPDDFDQEVLSIMEYISGEAPFASHPLRAKSALESTVLAVEALKFSQNQT